MSKSLLLVTIGNVSLATAQWYLVWLFARQDGAHAVGQYSSLIALLTPVFISSQLGLRNLFITLRRHVPWGVYLGVRLTSIVGATLIALLCLWLFEDFVNWRLAGAVLTIKICDSVADLYFARLQKAERLVAFGTVLILNAVATTTVVTILMLGIGSVIIGVWGAAAIALASACVTARLGSRAPLMLSGVERTSTGMTVPARLRRFRTEAAVLMKAGVPMSLMQGVYSLLSYAPLAVVGMFGSSEDVGRYASAAYLVVFANLVGASAETVVLPGYRRLCEELGRTAMLQRAVTRGFAIMGVLAPLVVLGLFIGPWLLRSIYGDEFVLTRSAVGLLSLAAIVTVPTYLTSATLLVLNRYWATTFVGAASIVLVLASGWIAGVSGVGAVEVGCLALLCGSIGRFVGERLLSHLPSFRELPTPRTKPARSKSGGSSEG